MRKSLIFTFVEPLVHFAKSAFSKELTSLHILKVFIEGVIDMLLEESGLIFSLVDTVRDNVFRIFFGFQVTVRFNLGLAGVGRRADRAVSGGRGVAPLMLLKC